jgi:hypothetical protein
LAEKRIGRFEADLQESRLFDFVRNMHHLGMKAAPLCFLGALAACQNSPPVKPKQLLNIEFAGSPECLAGITNKLLDMDMGLARAPVWSKDIGKMEMGPIDRSKLPTVIAAISEQACAKDVRTRPCATPLSDVVICPSENP